MCHEYLIIEDFFPTILEMAGISGRETVQQVDGRSFMPMLLEEGTSAAGRDLFWHYPNKWGAYGPGIGTTSTIRSGDWKLVYCYKDGMKELFNIREDIGESNNLSGNEPGIVSELSGRLGTFLREVNADRPSFRDTGLPAPWPDEL